MYRKIDNGITYMPIYYVMFFENETANEVVLL